MDAGYKIIVSKKSYKEVLKPLITKAKSRVEKTKIGDKIELHILDKALSDLLQRKLIRTIDEIEVVQKAFHAKEKLMQVYVKGK